MNRINPYQLENDRRDKVKSLGFICYNLYVDNTMCFPEMDGTVRSIKAILTGQNSIQLHEELLNEKIIDLGFVCYNLYTSGRVLSAEIMSICNDIAELNRQLKEAAHTGVESPESIKFDSVAQGSSGLDLSCPFGMEFVPPNHKECRCGYRNRPEAIFCGKCGTRL